MKKINRRDFLKFGGGLMWLVLGSCDLNKNVLTSYPEFFERFPKRVSYKLEDLCDTKVDWKDITLNVFIEDSKALWDSYKYKEEIFDYVKDFFKEQKVNCLVVYSNKQFEWFDKSNEFGLEVWGSKKEKEDRSWQLYTGILEVPKGNLFNLQYSSLAVTRAQVSLIDGRCRSYENKTQEEVNKLLVELYKKDKEFILKKIAAHFCHEVLHCMSLFHVDDFKLNLIKKTEIPNIMLSRSNYFMPKFKKNHSLGYSLNPLQQKLIHSFIAGNNTYKAFVDSQKDMTFYLENLAEANSLELESL